jgi:hypothetical protein
MSWADLSPKDWSSIFGSMLLTSSERHNYESFGGEKMALDACLQRANNLVTQSLLASDLCTSCLRGRSEQKGNSFACTYCEKDFTRVRCNHCKFVMSTGTCGELCTSCRYGRGITSWNESKICCSCSSITQFRNGRCSSCGYDEITKCINAVPQVKELLLLQYAFGQLKPSHSDYNKIAQLDVPESPSDPKHFGHLLWKFCRFIESTDGQLKAM